jgi:hypothetical protein
MNNEDSIESDKSGKKKSRLNALWISISLVLLSCLALSMTRCNALKKQIEVRDFVGHVLMSAKIGTDFYKSNCLERGRIELEEYCDSMMAPWRVELRDVYLGGSYEFRIIFADERYCFVDCLFLDDHWKVTRVSRLYNKR